MKKDMLPRGFESLTPFLDEWGLQTTTARMQKRNSSKMEELQAFYDAMFPLLEQALQHLAHVSYDESMTPVDRNLLSLCLSLAEITTAIEWYGQPSVIDGYAPEDIHVTHELP